MFRIRWRNRAKSLVIVAGLSTYANIESATEQVARWKMFFPQNSYYIEEGGW